MARNRRDRDDRRHTVAVQAPTAPRASVGSAPTRVVPQAQREAERLQALNRAKLYADQGSRLQQERLAGQRVRMWKGKVIAPEVNAPDVRSAARFLQKSSATSVARMKFLGAVSSMAPISDAVRDPMAVIQGRKAPPSSGAAMHKERVNASCLRESRPASSTGDGSSRAFVPWCSTGRGHK